MAEPEGVPSRRVQMGLLRSIEEPLRNVVHHGHLWQPDEGCGVLRSLHPASRRRSVSTILSTTTRHATSIRAHPPGRVGTHSMHRMTQPLLVEFAGGPTGRWKVERIDAVRGEGLPSVERIAVVEGRTTQLPPDVSWVLRGVTSNERYVTQTEHDALVARQPPLGREEATRAALIPICKSSDWWEMSQDGRRSIFEERSHHVATGVQYLPAVARRLHHGRDLMEPFDFLTWFEYAPEEAVRFEQLTHRLRETEEWSFVEREVDIRLSR